MTPVLGLSALCGIAIGLGALTWWDLLVLLIAICALVAIAMHIAHHEEIEASKPDPQRPLRCLPPPYDQDRERPSVRMTREQWDRYLDVPRRMA